MNRHSVRPWLYLHMWTETYAIGNAVTVLARALIPIIGVIFFGWSAPKLLIIYFADTAAAYYAYLAMIALSRRADAAKASSAPGTRARDEKFASLTRAVLLPIPTLLLVGFCFGVLPLFAMIEMQDVLWRDILADTALWRAVFLQFAIALGLILERALRQGYGGRTASSAQLQGACIAVRWLAVLFIAFFLSPGIPRVVLGPLLVAAYAILTALLEIAPYRVLGWVTRMTGKAQ